MFPQDHGGLAESDVALLHCRDRPRPHWTGLPGAKLLLINWERRSCKLSALPSLLPVVCTPPGTLVGESGYIKVIQILVTNCLD